MQKWAQLKCTIAEDVQLKSRGRQCKLKAPFLGFCEYYLYSYLINKCYNCKFNLINSSKDVINLIKNFRHDN